jgi:dodecin
MIKIIEVTGASTLGFNEATQNAISEATQTVSNIRSVYIQDMNTNIENNRIVTYAVNAKVAFEVKS